MAKGSRGKAPAINDNGSVFERSNTRGSKMTRNGGVETGHDNTGTSNGKDKEEKKNAGLLKWLFKRNAVA
jgi:hypothetical protein